MSLDPAGRSSASSDLSISRGSSIRWLVLTSKVSHCLSLTHLTLVVNPLHPSELATVFSDLKYISVEHLPEPRSVLPPEPEPVADLAGAILLHNHPIRNQDLHGRWLLPTTTRRTQLTHNQHRRRAWFCEQSWFQDTNVFQMDRLRRLTPYLELEDRTGAVGANRAAPRYPSWRRRDLKQVRYVTRW